MALLPFFYTVIEWFKVLIREGLIKLDVRGEPCLLEQMRDILVHFTATLDKMKNILDQTAVILENHDYALKF